MTCTNLMNTEADPCEQSKVVQLFSLRFDVLLLGNLVIIFIANQQIKIERLINISEFLKIASEINLKR